MEKNLANFYLELGYLFSLEPEENWQKKEEAQRFTCLDDRELDDLVEGTQAKTTKYARQNTQYAFFKVILN